MKKRIFPLFISLIIFHQPVKSQRNQGGEVAWECLSNGKSLEVLPVLTTGKVNLIISSGNSQYLDVLIFDNLGRMVFSEKKYYNIGKHSEVLDLSGFQKGLYFVPVRASENMVIQRRKIVRI